MNSQKLKGKIVEMNKNYTQCAKAIGVSQQSFYKKVNGKSKFFLHEAEILGNFLEMTNEEKILIFFA